MREAADAHEKPLLVFLAFWSVFTLISLCQDVRLKVKKEARACHSRLPQRSPSENLCSHLPKIAPNGKQIPNNLTSSWFEVCCACLRRHLHSSGHTASRGTRSAHRSAGAREERPLGSCFLSIHPGRAVLGGQGVWTDRIAAALSPLLIRLGFNYGSC